MSQDVLASQLGVSRQAVSKWEAGMAYPDIDKVGMLCELFSCSADSLLNPDVDDIVLDEKCEISQRSVGENIKRIRTAKGIPQEVLAERLAVSRQSVSKWETGNSMPKTETLISMLPILECSMDELLTSVHEETMPVEVPATEAERPTKSKKNICIAVFAAILLFAIAIVFFVVMSVRDKDKPEDMQTVTDSDMQTVTDSDTQAVDSSGAETNAQEIKAWNGTSDTSWYSSKHVEFDISTPEQLAGLAKLVNTDGISFENRTINLKSDMLFSNKYQWTPIGKDETNAFKGIFDGGGHTVSGISVTNRSNSGVFGVIWGGTVKNLTVSDSYFNGTEAVGGICGLALSRTTENPVTIANCKVMDTEIRGDRAIGGIVGRIISESGSIIANTCDFSGHVWGYGHAGGICGEVTASGTGANANIVNCLCDGNVCGTVIFDEGQAHTKEIGHFGGILGYCEVKQKASVSVSRCINEGDICKNTDARNVGGIVGKISSESATLTKISDSYNTGSICVGTKNSIIIGGILGATENYGTVVSRCYNAGEMYARYYCGGIVGLFITYDKNSKITECVYAGNIKSTLGWIDESIMAGNWQYFSYYMGFGGIAGYCNGGVSNQYILSSCYANGPIDAQYKGGLVGEQKSGNAKWTGNYYNKNYYIDYTGYGNHLSKSNCGTINLIIPQSEIFYNQLSWSGEYWDTSGEFPVLIR